MSNESKTTSEQVDTSDEACAVACMIVSNPQSTFQTPGWKKRVNDLIRALRDERNNLRDDVKILTGLIEAKEKKPPRDLTRRG